MNRTFEDIVKMPELTSGTEVTCRIGESNFDGKIVGKKLDHSNIEGLIDFLEKKKKQDAEKKTK